MRNDILGNLRETYLHAAADLEMFPEGSAEYRRAELAAMNTSRTVFELFGATAAEDLRAAGLQERSRIAERMRRAGHATTNFEKITASRRLSRLSSPPSLYSPGRGTRLFTVGIATLARRRSAASARTKP